MRFSIAFLAALSVLAIASAAWPETKQISKPKYDDITITKPVDKSSPTLLQARRLEEARNACSTNPNCRLVRDDSDLTAFCVGDNCVAARKAGKGQQEFIQIKMSDILVSSAAHKLKGKPITTSSGIIAILIGRTAPTPQKEPGKLEIPNVSAGKIKGESKDSKHGGEALRTPPPANLLEGSSPAAPSSAGPARAGTIRKETIAPTLGPTGPSVK
jgi:hypothetical protein